ncbi:hypothetical protein M1843_08430 [Isoptericola sp. 4D.3]|uniref:SnoaL-like domain-containing protein n=1 Tax=Isoptericola peretonis TaxID=2918523 RepID=A0ABT0J2R0_9MICO|nr:hypothetical protein [Isoptericola sp. 4D.3]
MGTPTSSYDGEALSAFLADLGLVLGAEDLEAVTDRYDLPALFVGPEKSTVLGSPEEVLDLSRQGPAAARAREAVAVLPELVAVEEVGWALLWVDVRWSYRDELAGEIAGERCRYLLRRGRGTFEVCVVAPVE